MKTIIRAFVYSKFNGNQRITFVSLKQAQSCMYILYYYILIINFINTAHPKLTRRWTAQDENPVR